MFKTRAICTNSRCHALFLDLSRVPNLCGECGSPVIESCPRCKAELPDYAPWPVFCEMYGAKLRFHPEEPR